MAASLRIAINGAAGRMGQNIIALIEGADDLTFAGGLDRLAPYDATEIPDCDVMIDFSAPSALLPLLERCTEKNIPLVTGTTGLSDTEQAQIISAVKNIPIMQAGNMSMGVNLLAVLVEQAATRLGEDYDIEIHEAHHRLKKDAPSGTALMLGHAAAKGRNVSLNDKQVRGRDGITGERETGSIGFSVIRAGAIVGDHEVSFSSDEETLTLSHHARDRSLFARGALQAARWINGRNPGLYSMRDVLGFEKS